MTDREQYAPGPARAAQVRKDGEKRTLILVRELPTRRKLRVEETRMTRAGAPKVPKYNWWGRNIRWELGAFGGGTRLTLWQNLGGEAMKFGWLNAEYARQVGMETPNGPPKAARNS